MKGPKYHQTTPRLPGEWREPKYLGDIALSLDVTRGDETGVVRVEVYGPDSYMVASYLPGLIVDSTPKVEPERAMWCETRADASEYFASSVVNAFRHGWKPANTKREERLRQIHDTACRSDIHGWKPGFEPTD